MKGGDATATEAAAAPRRRQHALTMYVLASYTDH